MGHTVHMRSKWNG